MRSVESALETILSAFNPVEAQSVPLTQAVGRVLAGDVTARTCHPPRDISAMDGYAVRSAELRNPPHSFPVAGISAAGGLVPDMPEGQVVRIFTGGAMPMGADAVVLQENTQIDNNTVTIDETVDPGRFVRRAGLDFKHGATLLRQGQQLTPRAIALAAAMNHAAVPVYRQPRVGILSTGDEIVPPGSILGDHQIPGSNGPGLMAFIQAYGGIGHDLGIARDDHEALGNQLASVMPMASQSTETDQDSSIDLLVTTGGVSVGDRDFVQGSLVAMGLKIAFWKIAMQPGKPLLFGHLETTPVLALPGNPVSAMVCAHIFLRPILDRLLGRTKEGQETITAYLVGDLPANGQRQNYMRARLKRAENRWLAEPFAEQDSTMIATLAQADALLIRPPHAPDLTAGSPVTALPLESSFPK